MRSLITLGVLYIIILFLAVSCNKVEPSEKSLIEDDSLISEIMNADLIAFYDAGVSVKVPDYLLVNEDTIQAYEGLLILSKLSVGYEPNQYIKVDSNNYLIIRKFNDFFL